MLQGMFLTDCHNRARSPESRLDPTVGIDMKFSDIDRMLRDVREMSTKDG
jgi:hypothetical protein